LYDSERLLQSHRVVGRCLDEGCAGTLPERGEGISQAEDVKRQVRVASSGQFPSVLFVSEDLPLVAELAAFEQKIKSMIKTDDDAIYTLYIRRRVQAPQPGLAPRSSKQRTARTAVQRPRTTPKRSRRVNSSRRCAVVCFVGALFTDCAVKVDDMPHALHGA